MTIQEVKDFLRVDGNDDDFLIDSLMATAEIYIRNATRPDVDTESELYNTASKILISHWYENREPIGKTSTIAFSLESMLIQLAHCGVSSS